MNFAGALADLVVLRRQAQQAGFPEALAEMSYREQRDTSHVIADSFSAAGGSEAEKLLSLVEPVPMEIWIERGEPGLPFFDDDAYRLMRSQFFETDAHSPVGQRLRSTRHLEARPIGGVTVILPGDGDSELPTVGLLSPVPAPEGVRLASVSVPFEPERSKEVANEIHESARAASEDSTALASKCSEGFMSQSDGWHLGCIRGTCKGRCLQVVTRGERGVDSFRCMCRLATPPDPDED